MCVCVLYKQLRKVVKHLPVVDYVPDEGAQQGQQAEDSEHHREG